MELPTSTTPLGKPGALRTACLVLRLDQIEALAALQQARPGSSRSDIARDVIDEGLPVYRKNRALLRSIQERSA
jgi:hypothetical protein